MLRNRPLTVKEPSHWTSLVLWSRHAVLWRHIQFLKRKVTKMKSKTKSAIFVASVLILFSGALSWAVALDDPQGKDRQSERGRQADGDRNESSLKQIDNPTYKEKCGACHFAYQPELMPSASWTRILTSLDDHFGETVELDEASKRVITDFLVSNGAENSSAKRAVKIMRSLGNQVPLRITDIPYIRNKHHKISSDVLNRKSIGSLSNCSACHTTAENANYEDDNVKIPE
jgi:hypothetical protein